MKTLKQILQKIKIAIRYINLSTGDRAVDRTIGKGSRKVVFYILVLLVGIILLVVSSTKYLQTDYNIHSDVYIICVGLAQSLISAAIIGYLLDLPLTIEFVRERIIDVFKSKNYLKDLDMVELRRIRKECTRNIYLGKTNRIGQGLLDFDEKVCDLLTESYYEYYRINTNCSILELESGNKVLKKRVITKFKLINPLNHSHKERRSFPPTYYQEIPGVENSTIVKIIKFEYSIDGSDLMNIADKIEVVVEEKDVMRPGSYQIPIRLNDTTQSDKNSIEFEFNDVLVVTMVEERIVPLSDTISIFRINKPAESFLATYIYSDPQTKLIGSLFGSISSVTKGGLRIVSSDDCFEVESLDWLMPTNGYFVAIVPKEYNIT